MRYELDQSIIAARQMGSFDRYVAKRIHENVDQLYKNLERFVEKLVKFPYYRHMVEDYRVILNIKHESVRILILNVRHRSKIDGR